MPEQAEVGSGQERGDVAPSIVALIPAYQAGHLLAPVVGGARAHLPVWVIDDGSTDDTAVVAEAAGAGVIHQIPNQGKGAALRKGFRHALAAGCEAVLTLDADGQHDPAEIPKFLAAYRARRPALIIGARNFAEMPFVRRMSNTIGRKAISWAIGRDLRDNQSGYRLITRPVMEAVADSPEAGFEFEVEMIVVCVKRGWEIDWVPIRTIYGEQGSHIRPVEHVVGFFRMVQVTRRMMRG
ncbi:MAG: glycosyltransferase family 2 protein [Candidatus Limnocylindria bacterium]